MKSIIIRFLILFVCLLLPLQVLGTDLPTVSSLQDRLAAEVQEMIDADHLAPAVCYSEQHYVAHTSTGAHWAWDDYWHNPGDLIYTLSIAIPHLPTGMQSAAMQYLEDEFDAYPPYTYVHMGTSGVHRSYNGVPTEYASNWGGWYGVQTSTSTTVPSGQGFTFYPFNIYACYKFAQLFPSRVNEILTAVQGKVVQMPDDIPLQEANPHIVNMYIAGYYGYQGLRQLAGLQPDATVQGWLNNALSVRVQILNYDPIILEGFEAGGFCWLVPELGQHLRNNALTRVQEILAYEDWARPYWYIARAQECTRYYSGRVFMEGYHAPIYDYFSLFAARAHIIQLSQPELKKYLDVSSVWCGDLYYIQNLVHTINASTSGNQAPTVDAGSNQTITLPDDDVSLDGTVSDDGLPDPPGTVTQTWTKQSGPGTVTFGNANAVDTTATFSTDGVYVLRLTASDSELSNYDDVTITVNPESGTNQAPTVDAGSNDAITLPDNDINLDGTVSDDGLPNPPATVTQTWTKQSGPGTVTFGNANAVDTTATFSAEGVYALRLTASDSDLQAYDEATITVNPEGGGEPTDYVLYYDLDDGSGTTATDSSSSGNNGTLSGSPAWTSNGQIDGALTFDGTDDYITCSSETNIANLPTGDFTVTFWQNWDRDANEFSDTVMGKYQANGWQIYELQSECRIYFVADFNTTDVRFATANNSAAEDTWQHVAVVFDSSTNTAKIYLDGAEPNYSYQDAGVGTYAGDSGVVMQFGRAYWSNNPFRGMLDDIRIYDRELSSTDVNAVMNSGGGASDTTPPMPDPLMWATVPYSTGTTSISMTATTASDASGVEYFFDCTAGGGNDSAWQDSTTYQDTGLSPSTQYTYRVQARDKSANQNTGGWSISLSATTDASADTTPPTPDPLTWATVPYSTGTTSISMTATAASDPSGVEYYFDCTAGGGHDSGWQNNTTYVDTGLSPSTQYTYRVQARDKSINQNAGGWSTSQSATTNAASTEPVISNITTNEGDYDANQIPMYNKLEITFDVNTIAEELQLPYDPSPPAGVTAEMGISVNAEFTPDNWTTVYSQPAFLYKDFEYQYKSGRDWMYPTGDDAWKVRFAPNQTGTWKYRINAQDSGGWTETSDYTFTVVSSSDPGFLRVSPNDARYFEFENGDVFTGLGHNLTYGTISFNNPVHDNNDLFQTLNGHRLQLFRTWLSHWAISGSAWSAWSSPLSSLHSQYIPEPSMSMDYAYEDNDVSMGLFWTWNPGMWIGHMTKSPPVKQNTDYHIFIRYYIPTTMNQRIGGNSYGLVAKTSTTWLGGDNINLYCDPNTGVVVSNYAYQATAGWQTLEGSLNSGSSDYLPSAGGFFILCLENIDNTGGTAAYIDEVEIREDLGGGQYGPNIIGKDRMCSHIAYDQQKSYAFDKTLELAEQYDLYFKLVLLEKNEWIGQRFDHSGDPVPSSPSNDYFYGNWESITKNRWLQQAFWRYCTARWGYSPHIHSWELLNEGDPWNSRHYAQCNEFGKYMHEFEANKHVITTSTWHSWPKDDFWANASYPDVDYTDYHEYNLTVTDTADYTQWRSVNNGAYGTQGAGKPLVRGETGFGAEVNNDSNGIWMHNFAWAQINHGGMYEQYWCENNEFGQTNDPREHYVAYRNFIEGIPLNNGNYENAATVVSDPNIRAWGQKDFVNQNAHLWIQNKQHTWYNIVNSNPMPPVSGTVQIGGFTPSSSFTIQSWDTYEPVKANQITSSEPISSNGSGVISIDVNSLSTDVAIKILGTAIEDNNSPTPDPATWATAPYATGTTSISMTATTASDPSGVEYFFDCTVGGGNDSGWQDSTTYEDTGLSPDTQYTYRVQARDKSANQNTGGWSTSQSATTDPGTGGLPDPWLHNDIGAVAAAGDANYVSGVFTVDGSGADIMGAADEFHYVYQLLSGDGEIVARVASIENTNTWAKAGVMIRETLDANSANIIMLVTPGNGAGWHRRATTGGTTSTNMTTGPTAPVWVKVVRAGNVFTCSHSANGIDWTQQGSQQTISMASNVYVGLAVTSHNDGVLCTATFDNVTASGGAPDTTPPMPDPLTWATVPYSTGTTSISMTATTASDASGVEYFFDCTAGGGNDSGWQDSTTYQDTGLSPSTQYTYRVQARDKSANHNTGGWSTSESATTDAAPDTTPPTPDPATWASVPASTGTTSISMTATTASDPSGVEYYFDCTVGGGNDSAWQDSTTYQDTGLSPSTQYTYRVQARDKSANQNAGGWSTSQSATTDTPPDTMPPIPDPLTWATVPYSTGTTSISMTATTASDPSGVEYFFDCTAGGGNDSGWQDSTTYEDTGLSPSTQYTYRVQARDKSANQNAGGWSTNLSATTDTASDTTPPTPDPLTWATVPYSTGTTSISMTATTASDASGVEYFFDCTAGGGNDSAWQDSTTYGDTNLDPNTQYTYRVQARDKSASQNETTWSTAESATTQSSGGELPSPWLHGDIGDVGAAGDANHASGVFTVDGSGADIIGTEDEFHYAYQSLSGDGEIVARVASIENTNAWAKAGVMIRATLDANSANIMMLVTPSNGAGYHRRLTAGGSTSTNITTGLTAPIWVKIVRAGNNFTCSRSDNGTDWTQQGTTQTISMASGVYMGLAVTSHNDGVVCTATFDNVSTSSAPDTTPPTPDPATWASVPASTGTTSISMTATTASDASGVEYFFDCTAGGGNDSGWQDSTTYEDTGLSPSTQYTYRVQSRDKSTNQNATAWSTSESATTDTPADTTPPTPDPATWASVPASTGTTSISMTATTASDPSGVEYFFDCTAGGGNDSGWQDSTTYEDTGLSPSTQYTYRVQSRDKSTNQNATAWSTSESATTDTPADTTPPTPDPATWASVPASTGTTSISMTATTASDPSGVEYFFDCTAGGGNDSDWQDSTTYEDTGLSPSTQYTYRVQSRDKSTNQNATAWSTSESDTTDTPPDTTAPTPDPLTWSSVPDATGSSSITMTATTASDASGVEYYFDCTAGGGNDSGWQDSTTYEDSGLTAETQYSYRVRARDKSTNQNATAWSTTESATTDAETETVPIFDSGQFYSPWYGDTGTGNIPFDVNTCPDTNSTVSAWAERANAGWTEIRATADEDIGDREFLEFDCYWDTDTQPGTTIGAFHMQVNGDGGWTFKWEGSSVCWIDGDQQTFSPNPNFSGKTWQHFKLDLDTNIQGGTWPADPNIGVIRMYFADANGSSMYINNAEFTGGTSGPDTDPPTPDPMTFATVPYAAGPTSVTMTATAASDASGVEYYFECTAGGGNDSDWQDSTNYTDTGLSELTQYTYRVQARDKSTNQNATAWSTSESATTQDGTAPTPNPMTWATVPYAAGPTSISMVATTASDPSGVQYYFECTAGGGHNSGWQSSTSYTDTGLSQLIQYTYRVKARDTSSNNNETGWSTTQSATTEDGTAPTPNPMTWATVPYAAGPTSISMVATTASDPSGVQYYFECTAGGGHNSAWQSGASYTDTGLSQLTGYTYRVKARDTSSNNNETGWSTTQSATTQDGTAPTPNPLTWATAPYATGSTSISMTATTASDPSGVEYYFDCTAGAGGHDSGWQDSTTYEDGGLSPSTQYSYRVQTRDKSTNQNAGGWSTTQPATTTGAPDTTPPVPNPLTWATVPYSTGTTSISMTATTASDASGVEYFFDCTAAGGHDSGWQDSTTYQDTGLLPSTQYTYRVQARDKSANKNTGGWSTSLSTTTDAPPDTTPPTPNPLTWTTVPYATGSTSISMTATTASDPSGVEYFFDCTAGAGGHDSGWQASATYQDTGLSPSTQYSYRVQARDLSTNQNAGGWSTTQSATTTSGGVTLLQDSFETNFDKWTDGGTTNWDRATDQKYSGNYSAHAGRYDHDLISDNLNASSYGSITISFWYRDDDIDNRDNIYLQLYDGSSYVNRFELGNSSEDTWHYYETTINNSGADVVYFISNFRIKFEGTSIDRNENLWIDDVLVTVQGAPPDTTPPTPNPLTWATAPYATGSSSISMTATTASDPSGVEYYFNCTAGAGGHSSGWQDSATYQDTGLSPSTQYSYRAQTRDKSADRNTGSWSTTQSATTDDLNLVGWWKLDETSGSTASDDGAGNNDGTVSSATWASGHLNNALSFDGINDVVDVLTETSLADLPTGDFTVACWMNWDQDPNEWNDCIMGKYGHNGTAPAGWEIYVSQDVQRINFSMLFDGTNMLYRSSNNSITADTWVHIAVVYTASSKTAKIYIGGTEPGYATQTAGDGNYKTDSGIKTQFGRAWWSSNFYRGLLDDIRIYNRALNSSEIAALAAQ